MSVEKELMRRAQDRPFDPENGSEPLAWVYKSSPDEAQPSGFLNPAKKDRRLVFVPMDPKTGLIQLRRAAFVDASKITLQKEEPKFGESAFVRRFILIQQIDGLLHPVTPSKYPEVFWALGLYLGRLRMREMTEHYTFG